MSHPDYTYEARADLPGVGFPVMRQIILAQATASSLKVLDDQSGNLTVETAHGLIGLRPGKGAETAGMVAARDPRWLFVMKNAVIQQMRQVMPDVAEAMRWSDGDANSGLPPSFQFVRVREVEPLGPVFLRVTLEGETMTSHGDDAIHFRLVQPPKGVEPEWPTVAPNGSTAWSDGPGAPHKPVYTARSVDHGANSLVTDIFLHEGGRTTQWAQEVMRGENERRVVGLIGPSGGGLLKADRVLLASDETGFPAAARLLENLPSNATGDVLLEAEDGADCAYPIDTPAGISLRWLSRSRGEALGQAALDALHHHRESHVWFAGERQDATMLREAAKSAGWETAKLRISGFWRAETSKAV
ncbi:MAG: siderophore-interacting protein [Pseudomonadota bacterium]